MHRLWSPPWQQQQQAAFLSTYVKRTRSERNWCSHAMFCARYLPCVCVKAHTQLVNDLSIVFKLLCLPYNHDLGGIVHATALPSTLARAHATVDQVSGKA